MFLSRGTLASSDKTSTKVLYLCIFFAIKANRGNGAAGCSALFAQAPELENWH